MLSDNPKTTIPHREPFIWISRLMNRNEDGTEGLVEFDVNPENEVFKGHFPGNPIFPGVLQMEGSAQACMWIMFGVDPDEIHEGYFASIDKYRFKKMVMPGDVLSIHCKQVAKRASLLKWEVVIKDQNEALCSKGAIWLKLNEDKS